MGRPKYDHIAQTEAGAALYDKWLRVRSMPCCPEWKDFLTFYKWAMASGYKDRAILARKDKDKPYEADNCVWNYSKTDKCLENRKQIEAWNKTVNRIRKACGMEPLEGTEEAKNAKKEPIS